MRSAGRRLPARLADAMPIALPTMKVFEALVPRCRDPVTDMRSPAAAETARRAAGPGASLGIDRPFYTNADGGHPRRLRRRMFAAALACRLLAPLRHGDCVEQCPSSRGKAENTYARTEFFSV